MDHLWNHNCLKIRILIFRRVRNKNCMDILGVLFGGLQDGG